MLDMERMEMVIWYRNLQKIQGREVIRDPAFREFDAAVSDGFFQKE